MRDIFPHAVVLRPSILFGPEDEFFNRFAALARLSPALPLIGGGRTVFQPVFVGDVAAAIANTVENPSAHGQIYELGGPRRYSFKELLELILSEIGRERLLVPVPFALASVMGFFLGLLPNPLLTMDQVQLLKHDNTVSDDPNIGKLEDLGITPTAVEAIVPSYLERFRKYGQFEESRIS